MENYLLPLFLTLIAGLSTGIGGLISLIVKKENKKFLSISLGFSAGVMIYLSLIEIFPEAKESIILGLGEKNGYWLTVITFFLGIFLMIFIDKLLPCEKSFKKMTSLDNDSKRLARMGIFTAIAVCIHNFPEGIVTFFSSLSDTTIAIPLVIAIAIHNIPEGISVAMPIYYATGSRKKAFIYSILSGLSEPIGGILGFILLKNILNDFILGIILSIVAGIMMYISFEELLPTARKYSKDHLPTYGLILGMIFMAISLLLFI